MYLLILAYLIYIPTSQPVLTDISGFHINLFLMLSSWDLWNDGCKSKTRLYKGDKVTSGKHFFPEHCFPWIYLILHMLCKVWVEFVDGFVPVWGF